VTLNIKIKNVLNSENLTSTQKLIYVALASSSIDMKTASLSFTKIAEYTSLSYRTAISNVAILEKKGYLKIKRPDGKRRCNLYELK
jgi:DNA-binding MarR family transcriptional regulator